MMTAGNLCESSYTEARVTLVRRGLQKAFRSTTPQSRGTMSLHECGDNTEPKIWRSRARRSLCTD